MKHLLYILLLALSTAAFAQGTIITRDRQRIEYDKMKFRYNILYITLPGGHEKMMEDSLVYGFFQHKPVPGMVSPDRGVFNYFFAAKDFAGKWRYEQMRRSLAGKVGMYNTLQAGTAGGFTYLVKNDTAEILATGKANIIQQLKKYVGDNPEAVAMLDPDKFKLDFERRSIKRVLRTYNVAVASQPQPAPRDSTRVVIYKRDKDSMPLTIGSKSYTLTGPDVVHVTIPCETWIKVCLQTKEGQQCDVIEAPPGFPVYYEIVRIPETTTYILELQPSTAALADIKGIEKKREKNKD